MDKPRPVDRHLKHLSRSRTALRRLSAVGLVGLSLLLGGADAEAQFSAKGRGPRATGKPKTPAATQPRASKPPARSQDEALIERYEKLIISEPGEEVPLVRLAELVRERDGNLSKVLKSLEEKAKSAADPYPVLIAWAGMLAQDGRPTEAQSKLLAATKAHPERYQAWLLLGQIERSLQKLAEARSAYEKALPGLSGPEKSILIRTLRDLCLDLGDLKGAKTYHDLLVKDAQGNLFLRGELGRELLSRGKTTEAILELRKVAAAARGDARVQAPALRDLGQAQLEGSDLDGAVASLSRASKLAVASPGLRVAIDTLLADAHRRRGTLAQFLQELGSSANSPERLGLLGQLYEEEGQTDQAILAYKKALAQDARDIDIRLRLVRLLEVTGDIENAASEYGKLVKSAPDDIQLSLRYIEMLLAQGRRREAIVEWDRTEMRTRADPEAGLLLLDIAERLEEKERGERILARLAATSVRDPRFLVELGSRYYQSGDTKTARTIWKKILTLGSDRAKAHVLYGEVLIDHEAAEDGVAELRKAAEIAPDDVQVHQALALGLERAATAAGRGIQAQYEQEALVHFHRILKLSAAQAQTATSVQAESLARRHIVRIYKRRGDLETELLPLEKKLASTPPDLEAGRLLAEGYLASRRDDAAIRTLLKIATHSPGDRQALIQLEAAYTRAGSYGEAIAILERLVEADPRRAQEYYERMARAASLKNDRPGALRFAELAVQKSPNDPSAQAHLGDLYLEQGRPKEAESAYRKALAQDDRLHLVSLRLAELLAKTSRQKEALELLSHVMRTAREHETIRRATRRSLSLSVPLGRTRQVEEILRPLAIGRPEQPLYRSLLLEVLSAQMYPLLLTKSHGAPEDKAEAVQQLKELSDRSTGPLLAALADDNKGEQQTAISLLSHGQTNSSGRALLAFAEGSAALEQRLLAVLALGQMEDIDFTDRLVQMVRTEDSVRRGRLAHAALWVIAKRGDSQKNETLLLALREGDPEMRAYAALGLGDARSLPAPVLQRTRQELLSVLRKPAHGSVARSAAALALGKLTARGLFTQMEEREIKKSLESASAGGSTLLTQAALLGLAHFADEADARALLAQGLLDEDPEVRSTATLTAARLSPKAGTERTHLGLTAQMLLPDALGAKDLSASNQVRRILAPDEPPPAEARHQALLLLEKEIEQQARVGLRTSQELARATLGEFGTTSVGVTFGELLTEADLEVTPRAAVTDKALVVTGRLRRQLLSEILTLAASSQTTLRVAALGNLLPEDGELALAALRAGLLDEDTDVHQAALGALTRRSSASALELLSHYLDQETKWARKRRMAQTLGHLYATTKDQRTRTSAKALLSRLTLDKSPLVNQEATTQLERGSK